MKYGIYCILGFLLFFPFSHVNAEEIVLDGATVGTSGEDAPKKINSSDLVEFSASFSNENYVNTGGNPRGTYAVSLKKLDGNAYFSVSVSAEYGKKKSSAEGKADKEELNRLHNLLMEHKVPLINGWHKSNSALGCNFSLNAKYASGESISASGEGGVSVMPHNMPVPNLADFFVDLAKRYGHSFKGF